MLFPYIHRGEVPSPENISRQLNQTCVENVGRAARFDEKIFGFQPSEQILLIQTGPLVSTLVCIYVIIICQSHILV